MRKTKFVGEIAKKPLDLHADDLNFADIRCSVGRNFTNFNVRFVTDLFAVDSKIARTLSPERDWRSKGVCAKIHNG